MNASWLGSDWVGCFFFFSLSLSRSTMDFFVGGGEKKPQQTTANTIKIITNQHIINVRKTVSGYGKSESREEYGGGGVTRGSVNQWIFVAFPLGRSPAIRLLRRATARSSVSSLECPHGRPRRRASAAQDAPSRPRPRDVCAPRLSPVIGLAGRGATRAARRRFRRRRRGGIRPRRRRARQSRAAGWTRTTRYEQR